MQTIVQPTKQALGEAAAAAAQSAIHEALTRHGRATVVLATGASQFEMLDCLTRAPIDWRAITVFHLDEYVGLPETHPASFRRYLKERFLDRLDASPEYVPIAGDAPVLEAEIERLNDLLRGRRIDLCFAGIGENCHLAFNDPPADFDATDPYLVVTLDDACRRQQFGEGWFESPAAVPARAVSMSVRQIMLSERIIVSVPDARKARAVRAAVEGDVSNLHPASILQRHPAATLFLDPDSASLLSRRSPA